MNARATLVILTASVFAGGFAVGHWIGRNQVEAVPPPTWLYSEFDDITRPGLQLKEIIQARPDLWAEINKELIDLKPRIDEFRQRVRQIDADFKRDFDAVLTREQRNRLEVAHNAKKIPELQQGVRGATADTSPVTPASTPDQAPKVHGERSDGLVSSFVFVPYTTAKFVELLDLDEEQEEKLRSLLSERRRRFLRLCDDTPPPSLQLSRISDIIRRAHAGAK